MSWVGHLGLVVQLTLVVVAMYWWVPLLSVMLVKVVGEACGGASRGPTASTCQHASSSLDRRDWSGHLAEERGGSRSYERKVEVTSTPCSSIHFSMTSSVVHSVSLLAARPPSTRGRSTLGRPNRRGPNRIKFKPLLVQGWARNEQHQVQPRHRHNRKSMLEL
jgi:hypothetical protein